MCGGYVYMYLYVIQLKSSLKYFYLPYSNSMMCTNVTVIFFLHVSEIRKQCDPYMNLMTLKKFSLTCNTFLQRSRRMLAYFNMFLRRALFTVKPTLRSIGILYLIGLCRICEEPWTLSHGIITVWAISKTREARSLKI